MIHHSDYQKICPECTGNYIARRADQIYCSNSCLNRHKNRLARQKRRKIVPIDKVLHKNRDILKAVKAKYKDGIVSARELTFREYNFKFHTHAEKEIKTGINCWGIYEFMLVPMEGQRYKIMQHEPTV